jgi:hypothetical protein
MLTDELAIPIVFEITYSWIASATLWPRNDGVGGDTIANSALSLRGSARAKAIQAF